METTNDKLMQAVQGLQREYHNKFGRFDVNVFEHRCSVYIETEGESAADVFTFYLNGYNASELQRLQEQIKKYLNTDTDNE